MAFQLRRGQPVGDEARHVFDHQLRRAVTCLRDPKTAAEHDSFHDAHRHVKKARAALRVLRGPLGAEYRSADRRLRAANRMLGELADARAMIGTLVNLVDLEPALPARVSEALRARLVARAASLERKAQFDRLRRRAVRLLEAERLRIPGWEVEGSGRTEVSDVIEDAHRAARAAMRDALRRPSAETFHAWRRRVKREWHLLRLVAEHCGGRLDLDRRRLGALDASLGELHNVSVLAALVARDSGLTRRETAHVLLALRRYRRTLRRDAREMRHIFDEGPQQFSARVREAWGSRPAGATALEPADAKFSPVSSSSPPETRRVRQGLPSEAWCKAS